MNSSGRACDGRVGGGSGGGERGGKGQARPAHHRGCSWGVETFSTPAVKQSRSLGGRLRVTRKGAGEIRGAPKRKRSPTPWDNMSVRRAREPRADSAKTMQSYNTKREAQGCSRSGELIRCMPKAIFHHSIATRPEGKIILGGGGRRPTSMPWSAQWSCSHVFAMTDQVPRRRRAAG